MPRLLTSVEEEDYLEREFGEQFKSYAQRDATCSVYQSVSLSRHKSWATRIARLHKPFRLRTEFTVHSTPIRNYSQRSSSKFLRTIAAFKLLKFFLLCCLGVGAFKLLNPLFEQRLTHWVGTLAWNYNHGIVLSILNKITGLRPPQLQAIGAGAFLYAVLFAVEGIGLWLGKRWAEFLTIIATCSLLPLEGYELVSRATITRGIVLVLNVIVVVYLAMLIRRQDHREGIDKSQAAIFK